ncbi:MAG: hypothetical protein WDN47_01210 [Candidatus Doudnabacteria bacterium]
MPEFNEGQNNPEDISSREKEKKDLENAIEANVNNKAEKERLLEYIENEKQSNIGDNFEQLSPQYLENIRNDTTGKQAETKKEIEKIDETLASLRKQLSEIK